MKPMVNIRVALFAAAYGTTIDRKIPREVIKHVSDASSYWGMCTCGRQPYVCSHIQNLGAKMHMLGLTNSDPQVHLEL